MSKLDEVLDKKELTSWLEQQQKEEDKEKSIYELELEKKNISDGFEYVIKLLDDHINFETRYKSKLILIMAEKLEKTGFPQKEIIEHLISLIAFFTHVISSYFILERIRDSDCLYINAITSVIIPSSF
jgi:hypothetical protein